MPLTPGFMGHLGIIWPQVCMRVKLPGKGLPTQHCCLHTSGVLVHHLCLDKSFPVHIDGVFYFSFKPSVFSVQNADIGVHKGVTYLLKMQMYS